VIGIGLGASAVGVALLMIAKRNHSA
jgi:hypothetical protein